MGKDVSFSTVKITLNRKENIMNDYYTRFSMVLSLPDEAAHVTAREIKTMNTADWLRQQEV